MSNPSDAQTALNNSNYQLSQLQTEANEEFISQAADVIANAEDQGLTFAVITTFENCDIPTLLNYFQELGYMVSFPEATPNPFNLPFSDFGVNSQFIRVTNPAKMKLDWSLG